MKKLSILFSIVLLISCTKEVEVDNPALQTRIDQLQDQISDLNSQLSTANSQLSSANTQNSQFQTQIAQLQSDLAEAESDLDDAEADLEEVEEVLDAVSGQLAQIGNSIQYWFGLANGDYEFDVYTNGVFDGSYAWEIGLSEDDEIVFNSYVWTNSDCYAFIPAISLGAGSETYVNNVSFDDFGVVSYNVDGSLFDVTGDVNLYQTFTLSSGQLVFTLAAYQGTSIVWSLQSVGGISASDIPASDFCS